MMKRMTPMMQRIMQRLMRVIAFAAVVLSPALALAADDEKPPDARIQNFTKAVSVPEGGTALTWLLLILLTGVCLAALFKNAKRTHLD
jgi:hypothetical protein